MSSHSWPGLVPHLLLGFALVLSVGAVWDYAHARHDLGTTMGEEMYFGSRWGMASIFGAIGLLGWLPWFLALGAGVAWYALGGLARRVIPRLARPARPPSSDDDAG